MRTNRSRRRTFMPLGVPMTGCLLLCMLAHGFAAEGDGLFSESFDGPDVARFDVIPSMDAYGPVDTQAKWALEDGCLVGRSPRWPWSHMAFTGKGWGNAAVSFDLRILRATGRGPNWGGAAYKRYWCDENLPGFDAAVLVRFRSPESLYRIQFSTRTGEVALWKPGAGILCVGRAALETGKTYSVRIEIVGKRIRCRLGDRVVLDHGDPLPGPKHGRIGFGVCHSDVAFDNVRATRLESPDWPDYPAEPDFRYGPWQDRFAIFDRGEPVCWINPDNRTIERVRLRRGGPPRFLDFIYWKNVHKDSAFKDRPMGAEVLEQGETLRMKLSHRYSDNATSARTLRLTYEAETGRYLYDWDTTLEFKNPKKPASGYWRAEFIDPIWYNAWGPPGQVRRLWPCPYTWGLLSGQKGEPLRRPLNHDSNRTRDVITYLPGRSWSGMFGPKTWSPVVEVDDMEKRGVYMEMCHAFYDFHYIFSNTQSAKEAAPRYRAKFRYIAYPPEKSRQLLDAAALHPSFDNSRPEVRAQAYRNGLHLHGALNLEYPYCTSPVNRFANLVTVADSYSGRGWYGNYAVDKAVGVDDTVSIRFDGPQAAYGFFGSDHGFDALDGDRLAVEFMMKAKGASGEGLHVSLGLGWSRWEWERHFVVPIAGNTSWQPVRLIVDPGKRRHAVMLVLKSNAKGTVWVDNLSIRNLHAEDRLRSHPATVRPGPGTADLVMDLPCNEGAGRSAFDRSGWGNGGLLMGPEWVRDSGRWVLRFDGQDDYLMVPQANSLNPKHAVTLTVWCRPDVETGHSSRLMAKYYDLLLGLSGNGAPYAASGSIRAKGFGRTQGKPEITAGRWCHIALTYDGKKARLFVDGKIVSECEQSGELPASCNPLFIGTYLPHEGNAWFKGLIGGVRMYARALEPAEIAEHARTEGPESRR